MIEMSPAEIADRYTIVRLKIENTQMEQFLNELHRLGDEVRDLVQKGILHDENVLALYTINKGIWDYEEQLYMMDKTDLAKAGQIFLKINTLNAERTDVKRSISENSKTGNFDMKLKYYRDTNPASL